MKDSGEGTVTFEYSLEVRGYELDSFNHVNNAVYVSYMEQARWEVFRETGTLDYLNENRILPAVIRQPSLTMICG